MHTNFYTLTLLHLKKTTHRAYIYALYDKGIALDVAHIITKQAFS